jgi:hypothetical protein
MQYPIQLYVEYLPNSNLEYNLRSIAAKAKY